MPERLTRGEDELERTARPDRERGPMASDRTLGGAETAPAEMPRAETPLMETPPEAIDLADVLRGVAARLDSVLDERRSEPTDATSLEVGRTIERRLPQAGAREATGSTYERPRETASSPAEEPSEHATQADQDVRGAVVSTLVVRIGTDGAVLGPPRRGDLDEPSAPVEATADASVEGTRELETQPEPRPEAAAQPSSPVPSHEAKRLGTVALTEPVPPSGAPAATHLPPETVPATVAPIAPAHVDVSIEELRSRLAKRRSAIQEAESASAMASPQVRAALIVVRNVMVGVALGVVIAIGMALLG